MARSHFYARPLYSPARGITRIRRGWFMVYEICGKETHEVCILHNGGDRLQNLLKRGIPEDQARRVFYEMDEEPYEPPQKVKPCMTDQQIREMYRREGVSLLTDR